MYPFPFDQYPEQIKDALIQALVTLHQIRYWSVVDIHLFQNNLCRITIPDSKVDNNCNTSVSSLFSPPAPDSLCGPTRSLFCISRIFFVADVIAARSWLVRNHLPKASVFLVIHAMMPPLFLESRLIDCSRAISVHTELNGCVERLTAWFPCINSLWMVGNFVGSWCISQRYTGIHRE